VDGALSASATAGEPRRVLIVAGEPSGDLHAARLVRALRQHGALEVRGVAGPRMRAEGVQALVSQEELAVIGFSGIVARLPALLAARRKLLREREAFRPHAVVLVDYPGFNLRLGPLLHRAGARIFYYIGPQVWAWHAERAAEMARWVDRLAVVFPFEEPIFRSAGVPTTFVGHPLLDELEPEVDEATLRAEVGADASAPLAGLLPGSRRGELAQHLGVMLDAARLVRERHPQARCVLALAEGLSLDTVPQERLAGVAVVRGRTRAVQAHATCCAVASGTATLETALFGTPLVVCYKVGRLNYAIARRVVKLAHIGLPNIVAGHEVAPELLQGAFTAEALATRLSGWIADPAARARARADLAIVRERLGGPGASERAARALAETMA
jgi:lipid-A-disaccharide synthase